MNFDKIEPDFTNNTEYLIEQVKEENIKIEPDINIEGLEPKVDEVFQGLVKFERDKTIFDTQSITNVIFKTKEEEGTQEDTMKETLEQSRTEKFNCLYCGKYFKLLYYLDRHLVKHTGEKKYQCDECPQLFAYKQDIPRHKKTHRIDRVLLKCSDPSCEKSFTTKHALTVHEESHGENFVCDHCGKSFVTKQRLKTHTVKVHTKEFSLFCDKCGKGYLDKERNRSFRIHTEKCGQKDNERKPKACELCGKIFGKKSAFDRHMQSHTKRKDFQCDYCPKLYADKQNLLKHVITIHPENN